MEITQKKVTSLGLDSHDLHILRSTINILGHGMSSVWEYSKYSASDVVFADPESREGEKFIREHRLGMHSNRILVGIGKDILHYPLEHHLTKPLHSIELRSVLGDLEGGSASTTVKQPSLETVH